MYLKSILVGGILTMFFNNSLIIKSTITAAKSILCRDDFVHEDFFMALQQYLALTPFYVRWIYSFGMYYCNLLSLIKQHTPFYKLPLDKSIQLLHSMEKGNLFINRSLIMMLKLFTTMVYFDDDVHAQLIGYEHLAHCQ
jgi:hypothetical protein